MSGNNPAIIPPQVQVTVIDHEQANSASIFALRKLDEVHPLTLSEQLAEMIYRAIVDGEYQFGERIREDELSERYQVSRGPVREALRILEKDSVIRIVPHRGAHVTALTIDEVRDIFAIRKALIGLAIRNLTEFDAGVLESCEALVRKMEGLAASPDDHGEYVRASASLHLHIAAQSTNRRLAEMIRSLARQTFRYSKLALSDPERRKQSARGWRRMVDSLRAEKWEEAAKQAEILIDRSCRGAIKELGRQAAPPD